MAKSKFETPWQTYVDCLSTVLVVVIFFSIVLILLTAILAYTLSLRQEVKATFKNNLETVQAKGDVQQVDNEGLDLMESEVDIEDKNDMFVINYSGLDAEPTELVLSEFEKWIQKRDPAGKRSIHIEQIMTVDGTSFTDRRAIAFRRYYYIAKTMRNKYKNKSIITMLTVIQNEKGEAKLDNINKMTISINRE